MGASGQATIDFGAWPGSPETSLDVTGQTGLVAASEVEAWVLPVATADHSVDEHRVEALKVIGQYKVDGTLTIYGYAESQPQFKTHQKACGARTRLYGLWTVGWVWN